MSKPTTSTPTTKGPKDGILEMIKKMLGSVPKKTTAPGKLSGLPPMPMPPMAPKAPKKKTTQQVVEVKKSTVGKPSLLPLMAPKAPKKKTTTVVEVKKSTVVGKPGSKKPTTKKVKQVVENKVEKKVSNSSGANNLKMKGGCASMYKGKGAGCTKGKIGGNFGYFF